MAQIPPAKTKRNKKILELRDKRKMTFENIGKMLQISRARVSQIYHRENKRKNQRIA